MSRELPTFEIEVIEEGELFGVLVKKIEQGKAEPTVKYFWPVGKLGLHPGETIKSLSDEWAEVDEEACKVLLELRAFARREKAGQKQPFDLTETYPHAKQYPGWMWNHFRIRRLKKSPIRDFMGPYEIYRKRIVASRGGKLRGRAVFRVLTIRELLKGPGQATTSESDLLTRACYVLQKDAARGLRERLHDDDFALVPFRLYRASHDANASSSPVDEMRGALDSSERSLSKLLRLSALIPPNADYAIVSPSGMGKSTLLRYIQLEILKREGYLAVYLPVWCLADLRSFGWHVLRPRLAERLSGELEPELAERALNLAYDSGRLVILLDQFECIDETHAAALLHQITDFSNRVRLIVAMRPTRTGLLSDDKWKYLSLAAFDDRAIRQLFGVSFESAAALAGDHFELLSLPLLAFIIRRIIKSDRQGHPPVEQHLSNFILYSKLAESFLYDHQPRHDHAHHEDRIRDARSLLGAISYAALSRVKPQRGTLSIELCNRVAGRLRLPLSTITMLGLADLVKVEHGTKRPSLVFWHESIQEYFAADWIGRSQKRLKRVLSEWWHSKWREVLIFLAGNPRLSFVDHLSQVASEDRLNARLFLEARCASESQDPSVRASLISRLQQIAKAPPFCIDAFKGLASLNDPEAAECAWAMVTDELMQGRSDRICCELSSIARLLSEERLHWLIKNGRGCELPSSADRILRMWKFQLAERGARVRCDLSHLDNVLDNGVLLRGCQIDTLYRAFRNINDVFRKSTTLNLFSQLSPPRLKEKHVRLLINCLRREFPLGVTAICSLSSIAHLLRDDHHKAIFEAYWGIDDVSIKVLYQAGDRLLGYLDDGQVSRCVKNLCSSDHNQSWRAAYLLGHAEYHPDAAQLEAIAKCLGAPRTDTLPHLIYAMARVNGWSPSFRARKVLAFLVDERLPARRAALESVRRLREYATAEDVGRILALLDDKELFTDAWLASCHVSELLGRTNVSRLLCKMESIDGRPFIWSSLNPSCAALARTLDDYQMQEVEEQVRGGSRPAQLIGAAILGFCAVRLRRQRVLLKLLDHREEDVRYIAYEKLKELQGLGIVD